MKVYELIRQLAQLDPHAEVCTATPLDKDAPIAFTGVRVSPIKSTRDRYVLAPTEGPFAELIFKDDGE